MSKLFENAGHQTWRSHEDGQRLLGSHTESGRDRLVAAGADFRSPRGGARQTFDILPTLKGEYS